MHEDNGSFQSEMFILNMIFALLKTFSVESLYSAHQQKLLAPKLPSTSAAVYIIFIRVVTQLYSE